MISTEIFDVTSEEAFTQLCLKIFREQARLNPVYKKFIGLLEIKPENIQEISQIPFLPIEFFKSHDVLSSEKKVEITFTSSGTTGSIPSRHLVTDLKLYQHSYIKGFELFYGPVEAYTVLALLPSYLERQGSSLVFMADDLINKSSSTDSGFYLDNLEELAEKLSLLDQKNNPILLLGVSYALLDLVQLKKFDLKNTIVMETGGMKGRRKEMVREELHKTLKQGFGLNKIHSEYGMTELLSQAYSKGEGLFECPPWMKVMVRDPEDPFCYLEKGRTGGINIIDLANINSCSFIASQDLGRLHPGDTFEIVGRFDNSDIRGCNLMAV